MIELEYAGESQDLSGIAFSKKIGSVEDLVHYLELAIFHKDEYHHRSDIIAVCCVVVFNFLARKLRADEFTREIARRTIIKTLFEFKSGFTLLDHEKLLYPNYLQPEYFPSRDVLLWKHRYSLAKRAQDLLQKQDSAHPDALNRWNYVIRVAALANIEEFYMHKENILFEPHKEFA